MVKLEKYLLSIYAHMRITLKETHGRRRTATRGAPYGPFVEWAKGRAGRQVVPQTRVGGGPSVEGTSGVRAGGKG